MYIGDRMPTIRWTIQESDIEARKRQVEMNNLYRDAYLSWKRYYECNGLCDPITYSRAMEWGDKFESLRQVSTKELFDKDVLVKSFLGLLESIRYKFGEAKKVILNDAWVINLANTQPEGNVMMREFLKGFGCSNEQTKKQWEDDKVALIDMSEEMKDLYKVYEDAHKHLQEKERDTLANLVSWMRKFVETYDERRKVGDKLGRLKAKLSPGSEDGCNECEDEGDDE